MLISETRLAEILSLFTLCLLCGFWLLPGGVLALRRRARGEIQVDLRPGYRPATLYRLLDLYEPEGIQFFQRMLLADMIFPAVYGTLFYVLGDLSAPTHPTDHSVGDIIRVVGLAAAVFDYAENIFLFLVIRNLPQKHFSAARFAGFCTTLKALSILTALGALVVALITRKTF